MSRIVAFLRLMAFVVIGVLGIVPTAASFDWPPEQVRFDLITTDDGLPNSSVSSIVQDEQGFMWFTTQAGLCRYDGYEFTVYEHDPFDQSTLSHNLIQTSYLEPDGTFWLGTYGGLDLFDSAAGRFQAYTHDPTDPMSLSNDVVVAVCRGPEDRLWVGTLDGLNVLDEASGTFQRFFPDPETPGSLPSKTVRSLFRSDDGTLWIGTYGGLSRYDPTTKSFETYAPIDGDDSSLPSAAVMAIEPDPNDSSTLWIGTWDGGVSAFDTRTDHMRTIDLPDERIYTMRFDRRDRLWVGTWGGGLMLVDTQTGTVRRFEHDKPNQIPHAVVYSLCEDDSGIMWIGTNGGGVAKFVDHHNRYEFIVHDPGDAGSLPAGKVYALAESPDESIWCGIYSGGLCRIDLESDQIVSYRHDPDDPTSLSDDIVNTVLIDQRGKLWVGTNDGLNTFDPKTGTFTRYFAGKDVPWLAEDVIYEITETDDGVLWFGTNTGGASWYDPNTGDYGLLPVGGTEPHVSDGLVRRIVESTDRSIWIGTNNGLDRYDPRSGSVRHYANDPSNPTSLRDNQIKALQVASDGVLWIATAGGGVSWYQHDVDSFGSLTSDDGLLDDNVIGITEAPDGTLWFCTLRGISIYDPESSSFTMVNAATGLLSNELTHAALATNNGTMLLGSVDGITLVHPEDRTVPAYDAPVVLTDFRVAAAPVTPEPTDDGSLEQIQMPHTDGFITAEFAVLDYAKPAWNQFAYKLDGLDESWTYSGTRNYLSYTNLDSGRYALRIRGAGSTGNWSTQEISLPFVVLPPPWRSPWAYVGYVAVFAAIIGGVATAVRRRRRAAVEQIEEQRRINAELETKVRERTDQIEKARQEAEAATEAKSRFLANMSHEIRTPLNGIAGMLSLLNRTPLSETQATYVTHSRLAATNLASLVDDLLEFESIASGRRELSSEPFVLSEALQYAHGLLSPRAAEKGLTCTLQNRCPQWADWVVGDQHRLVQVISNLVSNAIKYTDEGSITIDVSVDTAGLSETLHTYRLRVIDTGSGIPQDARESIFESFTQLSNGYSRAGGGVGLGLAIVKQITEAMGGEVSVESEVGTGSIFTVVIPLKTSDQEAHHMPAEGPEHTPDEVLAQTEANDRGTPQETARPRPVVLVCEDEAINRLFIVRHLQQHGMDTDTARSGPEAVSKATSDRFDAILMDLGLPEFDGIEAARRIRAYEADSGGGRRTPIIALTAHSYAEDKENCFAAGMDGFVSKPIIEAKLDLVLKRTIATAVD